MGKQADDIIRETFRKLGDTLGIQIDIPGEMIANLAAALQTEIDRLEAAVEDESFSFLNELAGAFRSGESNPRPSHFPVEQVEDVRTLVGHGGSDYAEAFNRLRALFPATEPAEVNGNLSEIPNSSPAPAEPAEDAKPCGSNSVTLGWCKLTARHEGLHTNGTYFWGQAPAPAEPAEEETKAEPSTRQIADVIVEGRSQNMSWMQIAEMVKQVFFPTETGPWQDWPSLDAIPADVRTVWDKAGDEYRRTNGGWKFRSHGGKWQQITLPLDDYIDFAPFTTAAVAVWDPELGTRNDWTLNEGDEQ
ncbi:hypothetical protein KKP62_10355 [Rhodococcus sp. GOMB7]|uniref:hypothetical protein n=1 Tax=Rhodococcus sp. GOMB7 TaxID=2839033 RepID=UPI001C006AA5|nr:hypothetical protein [Rhodococcus sp. GOMB7]MBT9295364.1 hypothetical protein [Rhodococcus sp. GOMB7]